MTSQSDREIARFWLAEKSLVSDWLLLVLKVGSAEFWNIFILEENLNQLLAQLIWPKMVRPILRKEYSKTSRSRESWSREYGKKSKFFVFRVVSSGRGNESFELDVPNRERSKVLFCLKPFQFSRTEHLPPRSILEPGLLISTFSFFFKIVSLNSDWPKIETDES